MINDLMEFTLNHYHVTAQAVSFLKYGKDSYDLQTVGRTVQVMR
jgi:hypothetical protein